MIAKLIIRSETEKDFIDITIVNDLAFGQANEGLLVEKLRNTPDYIPGLSLVAIYDNKIVGHILFYPITINNENAKYTSLTLAPMSVLPEYQKKGIGSELVKQGLNRARDLGFSSVIVLGHAEYYPRFSFKPASFYGIKLPFDVPDNVFMAIELTEGTLRNVKGTVKYPPAFSEV
jgi:predicted N-acetyltransferase YhbS